MPVELQTRFLRVLQEREFRPLGTTKSIPANFGSWPPAIASRPTPSETASSPGSLLPVKDIRDRNPSAPRTARRHPKLADTFPSPFAAQLGRDIPQLLPETVEVLRVYPWPGNVRELQNAIEHSLVLCDGPVLGPQCLPREVQMPELAATVPGSASAPQTLEEVEKQALMEALRRAHGNKKRAAEILGIHRPTLYAKLRRFGLGDQIGSQEAAAPEQTPI
jgi:DNA-binding NtrC family response regulator